MCIEFNLLQILKHSFLPDSPLCVFATHKVKVATSARGTQPRRHQAAKGAPNSPPRNTASLDLCVSFIFFALVYTKKTNNQKHKARIIKLSAGTSPSPPHPGAGGGGGFETGRGRESPSPHTRGVSQEHFSGVSQGGCGWGGVGRGGVGCEGAIPRAPRKGPKPAERPGKRGRGVLEWGTPSPHLRPISLVRP